MTEINLTEAFGSYKTKPTRRGRSAVTPQGELVVSCWYAGFQKAQLEILRYEEDLTGDTGEIAAILRTHLSEALTREYDVHVIVAVKPAEPKVPDRYESTPQRRARTTYHPRKDLLGRVTSFDGERFVIEFRKIPGIVRGKPASKGAAKRLSA